eukprot:5649446-Alexandrium_andersonii.AAC.1
MSNALLDPVDFVEVDRALGLPFHDPAAVDADVDVAPRLDEGARRQEGPLHRRNLEADAAAVLLL